MSGSNFQTRVQSAIDQVGGRLIGDNLLAAFKAEMLRENVFQTMFGTNGDRIFIDKIPNWNETILPGLILGWKTETYHNRDTYFTGTVTALVALPVQFSGDYNNLRRVGNMIQRWMGAQMQLFDGENKVPGLTQFGYGAEFNYEGMAVMNGFSAPAIQISLPFKFDLQLLAQDQDGVDFAGPLDAADLGFIEQVILEVHEAEHDKVLFQEGVLVETGQVNI
jgi:hypothetical protein